jgi:nucleotide-binding universal stress UspA family protein
MDTFHPKLILAATDFSNAAAHALRYASSIAESNGARLIVIYVDEFIPPLAESAIEASLASISIQELRLAAEEKLLLHIEENVSSYVPFEARVIVGSIASSIIREANECGAGLLVMGTHGRSGVRRLVVGSVCETVTRAVSIPVLAVNQTASNHHSLDINKVICIVDQSPECADAVRIAAAIAPNARLILLKARTEESPVLAAESLMRLRRWLPRELVDRCELRFVDAAWSPEHLANFAASVGADLIATSATRSHGLSDLLRGSITDRIVQHSECPVLVVNASAVGREEEVLACTCDA